MKIVERTDVKIGQWYSYCCHRDLSEIETQEEVEEIVLDWDGDDGITYAVWETELEALEEIRERWVRSGDPNGEVEECDRRIEQIKYPKEDMIRHGAEDRGYDVPAIHMIDLRKQSNYVVLFDKKNKTEKIKEDKKEGVEE